LFANFDDSSLGGEFELASCPGCGLVFYDALRGWDGLEDYYRLNGYYASTASPGSGGQNRFDEAHQLEIIGRITATASHCRQGPVFDVGCGQGGLLKALGATGFQRLHGVDLLPSLLTVIARDLGLPAEAGPAHRLPFPGTAPLLLIYSHILEHTLEPELVLREARRRLAPGGKIYVEVPDASAYAGGLPLQELYMEHINHFDHRSLSRLLSRGGFRPLALERADLKLPGPRALKVLWAVAEPGQGPECIDSGTDLAADRVPAYLKWSLEHPLMNRLKAMAESGRPTWVWGISQLTMLLLGSSPLSAVNLAGLVDIAPYKAARSIRGHRISPPEVLNRRPPEEELLLAAPAYEEAMRQSLKNMKFPGRVWSLKSWARCMC
jgi:SAM-dependent methyltransferase